MLSSSHALEVEAIQNYGVEAIINLRMVSNSLHVLSALSLLDSKYMRGVDTFDIYREDS